jgi:hypothetical protein
MMTTSGLTWTKQREGYFAGTGAPVVGFTAPVASGASSTATLTGTNINNTVHYGFDIIAFTGQEGAGASAISAAAQANNPTISITTTQANSAIAIILADWGANPWPTRTWLQPGGIATFVETATAQTVSGQYSTIGGYYPDAGVVGAKTIGLSAPTTGTWTLVAMEIKGISGISGSSAASEDGVAGQFSPHLNYKMWL